MKKVWKVAGGTGAIALVLYFFLGGFSTIEMELVQSDGYRIQGRMFEGKYNAGELESLFFEMKAIADSTGAMFAIVNFNESLNEETGDIKQFVGVVAKQTMDSLDSHEIPAGQIARASITAHNFVMPKPAKVRRALEKLSPNSLVNYSIEVYTEEKLLIEIPVQVK